MFSLTGTHEVIYSIIEEFCFFFNIIFRNNISPITLGSFSDLFNIMLGKIPDSSGVNPCDWNGRGYHIPHMEKNVFIVFKVK